MLSVKEKDNQELDSVIKDVKLMLKAFRIFLLISAILLLISTALLIPSVFGGTDIDYTFTNDTLFTETIPDNYYNTRNQTIYTNTYNGTFTFTSETGDPTNWTVSETGGADIEVISEKEGHNDVLFLDDVAGSYFQSVQQTFTALSGSNDYTLEFWLMVDDIQATDQLYIRLRDGSTTAIHIILHGSSSQWSWYDSGYNDFLAVEVDTWLHWKLVFNINSDDYDIYINGNLEVSGATFDNNVASIDNFWLGLGTPSTQDYWFDALGYDWQDYNEGDNVVPYSYTTSILETDYYSFEFNEDGSATAYEQSDVPFFSEKGDVSLLNGSVYASIDSTTKDGFYKDFEDSNSTVFNVYVEYTPNQFYYGGYTSYIDVDIQSYDESELAFIRIKRTTSTIQLIYYDGSENVLHDITAGFLYAIYNITISSNMVSLYFETTSYNNTFYFPTTTANKEGIGTITFESWNSNSYSSWGVLWDTVGIYNETNSLSEDFRYMEFETNEDWRGLVYYNVEFNGTGYFSLIATGYPYPERINITSFDYYNGSYYRNVYENTSNTYDNYGLLYDAIIRCAYNGSITFNSITVYGFYLTDGADVYYPSFTFSNTQIDESNFSVSGSDLDYGFTANESSTESISISFDINNVLASNRSCSITGYKSAGNYAYFYVDYTDGTSSSMVFTGGYKGYNPILPQSKEIDGFRFVVSDLEDNLNITTTGFFQSFTLIYYTDLSITITTDTLLNTMIPILIILIPAFVVSGTISVYLKRPEVFGKVFIPMFIVGAGICFAGVLIPAWLFAIITIACLTLIFTGDDDK